MPASSILPSLHQKNAGWECFLMGPTTSTASSLCRSKPESLGFWPHFGSLNITCLRTSVDDAVVADLHIQNSSYESIHSLNCQLQVKRKHQMSFVASFGLTSLSCIQISHSSAFCGRLSHSSTKQQKLLAKISEGSRALAKTLMAALRWMRFGLSSLLPSKKKQT